MNFKEQEIRNLAFQTPFIPFTIVTSSGERLRVQTGDHIHFDPNLDLAGHPLPDEERSPIFTVYGNGKRIRLVYFESIDHFEVASESAPA